MNLTNYTVSHTNLVHKKILNPWKWLIGEDKEIIVVTKMGDLLLKDSTDKLFFLSTCEGSFETISNYYTDFFKNKLSPEQYYEIFLPNLIADLEEEGKHLNEGQVYSYVTLPVMGGIANDPANIQCLDIYKHFILTGFIHKELDELSEETLSE